MRIYQKLLAGYVNSNNFRCETLKSWWNVTVFCQTFSPSLSLSKNNGTIQFADISLWDYLRNTIRNCARSGWMSEIQWGEQLILGDGRTRNRKPRKPAISPFFQIFLSSSVESHISSLTRKFLIFVPFASFFATWALRTLRTKMNRSFISLRPRKFPTSLK